ncbi:hypothetical protein BGZ49_002657 [Haplosporangium sp. Z 27]|nr:hypothetical protein BGZ49_002657 [Haplosporangium sp. Z 27]
MEQIEQLEYRQKRLMGVLETFVSTTPDEVSNSTCNVKSGSVIQNSISLEDSNTVTLEEELQLEQSKKSLLNGDKDVNSTSKAFEETTQLEQDKNEASSTIALEEATQPNQSQNYSLSKDDNTDSASIALEEELQPKQSQTPSSSKDDDKVSTLIAPDEAAYLEQHRNPWLNENRDSPPSDDNQGHTTLATTASITDAIDVLILKTDLMHGDQCTDKDLTRIDSLDLKDSGQSSRDEETDIWSISRQRSEDSENVASGVSQSSFGAIHQSQLKSRPVITYGKNRSLSRTADQQKIPKSATSSNTTTAKDQYAKRLDVTKVHRSHREIFREMTTPPTLNGNSRSHQQDNRKHSNIVIEIPPPPLKRIKSSESTTKKEFTNIVIEIPPWRKPSTTTSSSSSSRLHGIAVIKC